MKKEKFHKVMAEFYAGSLHSSSGDKVRSVNQAKAIAAHESGMKKKMKGM